MKTSHMIYFTMLCFLLSCQNQDSTTNHQKTIPDPFLNKTNALGQQIGFWETTDSSYDSNLFLKYDSMGRFEGLVHYLGNGKFNWSRPNLLANNTSSLKVNRLFSHNIQGMIIGVSICPVNKKSLYLNIKSDINEMDSLFILHIDENGKHLPKQQTEECFEAIKPTITKQGNKMSDFYKIGYFDSSFGRVEIEVPQLLCTDTQLSRLKLVREDGILSMGFGGNIQIGEYDLDQNGKKELYIFNFFSCESFFEVYQIKN